MTPSPGTSANFRSRLSLTLENLESLPKSTRSVDAFVKEQRRNVPFYADQAPLIISKERTVSKQIISPPIPPTTPVLKSRLEMQQELSEEDAIRPIPTKSQTKELFKGLKHARDDLNHGKVAGKPSNKGKRPRSPNDDEERSARLKERRDRKRVRQDIIKPKRRVATPEPSFDAESDEETSPKKGKKDTRRENGPETELIVRRKKGRGKASAGISLMETFTARNVKRSRLTLQPQKSGKLFKQVRSGEAVKLGEKKRESVKIAAKPPTRKSKPNLLETYSKHKSSTPKDLKASYKSPKNPPKSVNSDAGPSSTGSKPVYQYNTHEGSPQAHIEAPADDGRAAYSDSWGMGSSDTSSIHASPIVTHSRSHRTSTALSEPVITTITTPWNFEVPQSAFGRFETMNKNDAVNASNTLGKVESLQTAHRDIHAAPTRSRYFFSPLVPIPEHMQNAVATPGLPKHDSSDVQHADPQDARTRQPGHDDTGAAADEQQIEPAMAPVREPSPIDSLDRLLHEHDAQGALYDHLFMCPRERGFNQQPTLGQGDQEYDVEEETPMVNQFDTEVSQYEDGTVFDPSYLGEVDDEDFMEDRDTGQVATDDFVWEEDEKGYLYEGDMMEPDGGRFFGENERDNQYPAGVYSDAEGRVESVDDMRNEGVWQVANEGYFGQGEEDVDPVEAYVDVNADVLPFAEGRSLLLGLRNNEAQSMAYNGTRARRSSAYGQSMQEIEVMAARQLRHYW